MRQVSVVGILVLGATLATGQTLPVLPVARPAAKFQVSRSIERTVPLSAVETVLVANEFGNVEVTSSADDEVQVRAELIAGGDSKAGAESCLRALDLRTDVQDRRLEVGSTHVALSSATQYQTNLYLVMPATRVLRIDNAYGEVTVSGMQGAVVVRNRFGNASARRCRLASITNAFGDVNADHLVQGLEVSNRFGNISAHDLSGRVTIDGDNCAVRLIRSAGSARLVNRLGEVSASDCRGRVMINCVQGPVLYRQAGSGPDTVSIVSQAGPVRLMLPNEPSARIRFAVSNGRLLCPGTPQPTGPGDAGQLEFGDGRGLFELSATGADVTVVRGQE
jgi:hypothetical protein